MRCKTCDYPLWQITTRQCPECGTPFKPSDFEFTLNAVRFCCPHCEQAYYGTGPMGHLLPRAFNCVSCSRPIDMDEMVLLPTEGVSEHQTTATAVSWANRRNKGWFKSFFITMGMAMGNPNRAMDAVPEGSSAILAIIYMAIHVIPQVLFSGVVFFLWVIGMSMTMAGGGAAMGFIAAAVGTVIGAPLAVLLYACFIHGLLRLTGPTRGLTRTIHAVCYSAGNNFVCLVPCIGFYFCWVGALWWSISSAFMLARAHSVRAWRAAVAAVVPAVLAILLVAGSIAVMIFGVQSRVAAMGATMPGMSSTHTSSTAAGQRVANVLSLRIAGWPAHPADLLANHHLSAPELLLPGSASDTASCSVQNISLNELGFSFGTKQTEHQTALAADPALGGPACRVGDFVFTYAGMPHPAPDPNLWLAIGWPDPTLNPKDPQEVVIVRPNDVSMVIPIAQFTTDLDAQNDLRKTHNLPPLPHPRTVVATSKKVPGAMRSTVTTRGGGPTPNFGSATGAADGPRVMTIAGALRGFGHPTGHIAQLLGNESFGAFELMDATDPNAGGQVRRMSRISFGTTNLLAYSRMKPEEKRAEESLVADGVDEKTLAYRLGDLVFTHRGIDPALVPYGSKQRALWTVVAWPESLTIDGGDPDRLIFVGLADGSSRPFALEAIEQELKDQNALRAEFGLEPLPSPENVTHQSPALGSKPPAMNTPPDRP